LRRAGRGSGAADLLSFGGRVPPVVGGLILALVGVSLVSHLAGFAGALVLLPPAVLEGEVWRLATWTLVEGSPLSLLMAGLMLYWFGRDLAWAWGPRRLLLTWFLLGAAVGVLVTLLALVAPGWAAAHAGPWAVLSGLVVAWGLLFPERQMLFNFVIPMTGRTLAWATVGLTLFFAAFEGFRAHLPHFAAQALVVLWFRGLSARGAWQSLRIWLGQRRMRRRAAHLRVMGKGGKDDPPRWMN
jgi:membrane associated rhomboid family serine protease